VTVVVDGEELAVPIPTTYCHHDDIQAEVAVTLAASLAPAGLSAAPMRLPEKLLAVCAGVARYGRNNIAYVDGHGSFVELVTCVSDLAPGADPWAGPRSLPRCDSCEACRRPARPEPSGTTGSCCTASAVSHCTNESERPFPEWIDPPRHHCLVGCLRCQRCCPEDLAGRDEVAETAAFDERETALSCAGVDHELLGASRGWPRSSAGWVFWLRRRVPRVVMAATCRALLDAADRALRRRDRGYAARERRRASAAG